MKTNQDFKNAALAALKGKWAEAVLATATLFLIIYATSAVSFLPSIFIKGTAAMWIQTGLSLVLCLLVAAPVEAGLVNALKDLYVSGDKDVFNNMFRIGFGLWGKFVVLVLLMSLIVSVGLILLIVPGIYLSLCYSMAPFLIYDRPELGPVAAMKESRGMMKGHKKDLFLLCLSFLGWLLLGILTLGIGYLWLIPYMQETIAAFYQNILDEGIVEEQGIS